MLKQHKVMTTIYSVQ